MLKIFVDADACPVKDEIFRVARRCHLSVTLVTNTWMRIPGEDNIRLQLVDADSDAADDWIVENVEVDDIVITSDIPLVSRCLKKNAVVIGAKGKLFTSNNIGLSLATRDLLTDLRGAGEITKGPAPFQQKDRSRFLQTLDAVIQKIKRKTNRS